MHGQCCFFILIHASTQEHGQSDVLLTEAMQHKSMSRTDCNITAFPSKGHIVSHWDIYPITFSNESACQSPFWGIKCIQVCKCNLACTRMKKISCIEEEISTVSFIYFIFLRGIFKGFQMKTPGHL